jgi:hypothetical protein
LIILFKRMDRGEIQKNEKKFKAKVVSKVKDKVDKEIPEAAQSKI